MTRVIFLLLLCLTGCRSGERQNARAPSVDYSALSAPYEDIAPRWSPDGRRIAFLRRTPDRRQQLYLTDIYLNRVLPLLEPEMACPDRLFNASQHRYLSPDALAWSPDGKQIAFIRGEWFKFEDGDRLPGTGLWSLDTVTGRVLPLALHPKDYKLGYYYYRYPQWSPDGRYLAFVGEGISGERVIFVRTLQGQKADEVAPRYDDYEDSDWPVWKPESERENHGETRREQENPTTRPENQKPKTKNPTLVYRQKIQRAATSPHTETLRRVQPGSADGRQSGEIWRLRAVDYARLLAKRDNGSRRDPEYRLGLVQYPTPGTPKLEPVAPRAGHLAFSPDGKRVAFTLTPDGQAFDRYELWTLEPDTGKAQRVRATPGPGYLAPVWIDNDRLGVLSPNGEQYDVKVIEVKTGTSRVLGTIESADCHWSPDRRFIVYAGKAGPRSAGETTLRLLQTGL
jgi:Tol biopolymer transport system component